MSRPRRHPSERIPRRFTDATWLDDLPEIDAVEEDGDEREDAEGASASDAPGNAPVEAVPSPGGPPLPGAPMAGPPGREPRTDRRPAQLVARAAEPRAGAAPPDAPPSPAPPANPPPAPVAETVSSDPPDQEPSAPRPAAARPSATAPTDDPFAGAIAPPEAAPPPAGASTDPFADHIASSPPGDRDPEAREADHEPEAAAEPAPTPAPLAVDPFAEHINPGAATARVTPTAPALPKARPRPTASAAEPAGTPDPVLPAAEPEADPPPRGPAGRAEPRPAPALRTATRIGVPAVIWERNGGPSVDGTGALRAGSGGGTVALPPPSPVPSAPAPGEAPDPIAPGDCEICGRAAGDDALTRCPVCRRETCGACGDGGACALCSRLRVPDALEREMLAPLRPPADGVRISPPAAVRVVTIQSGPRRELAVMRDGTVERWWRSDRAEPNHYRVNRALEEHLGMRDAASLRVMPLAGAEERGEVLHVGGDGQLVAEITSIDAGGGLGALRSLRLDATPSGPSGLLRALAEELECDEDAVPWVVPSGLRRHFDQLVPAEDGDSPATISLAPTIRRAGVQISARGLVEPNGGVAPFAPVEPGSAPPLGGRLAEWFPRPRVVAAARGVTASAILLEVGDAAVLAVQDGDEVSYHAAAVPEPSAEEIIGGALNPDGRPAQVSSVIDPAAIDASRVINAELVSRRARPVARPSADWASAAAGAAAVARFRLDQAVRTPQIELDLPTPVAIALKTELMRGGVERPAMLEVGAEVHEHWRGEASESEHVYVIYPEDLAPDAPGCPELVLDDEGHFATHARRCEYCATTRCDDCEHLVRSCIICKIDLCASCRGTATIGLPVCVACSALAPAPPPRRFGLRTKAPDLLTASDAVHQVAVERHDDGWYLLAPDGQSRLPIARDYRVAGFLERRLDD